MKLRISFFLACAVLISAASLFTSCTPTDTPPTTTTANTDTWRDVSGLTDGTTYKFNITGGSSASTKIVGVSSYTSGTVRVFWTRGAGDSSAITVVSNSTASDAITWAAASGDISKTYRLYETSAPSSVGPSGLILGPTTKTASVTASDASTTIDIVLATISGNAPAISLQSADVQGSQVTPPARKTAFSDNPYNIPGGLQMDHYSSSQTTLFTSNANFADIDPRIHDSSSMILVLRTADGNYARVEVVPQAALTSFDINGVPTSGHYLWGDTDPAHPSTSKRFVDVKVTYQPTKLIGYASRLIESKTGYNTPRHSQGKMIRP